MPAKKKTAKKAPRKRGRKGKQKKNGIRRPR